MCQRTETVAWLNEVADAAMRKRSGTEDLYDRHMLLRVASAARDAARSIKEELANEERQKDAA